MISDRIYANHNFIYADMSAASAKFSISGDQQLNSIRESSERNPAAPSLQTAANTKSLSDIQTKLKLMDRKTDDAISRFSLFQPEVPASHNAVPRPPGLGSTRPATLAWFYLALLSSPL